MGFLSVMATIKDIFRMNILVTENRKRISDLDKQVSELPGKWATVFKSLAETTETTRNLEEKITQYIPEDRLKFENGVYLDTLTNLHICSRCYDVDKKQIKVIDRGDYWSCPECNAAPDKPGRSYHQNQDNGYSEI